MRGCSHKLGLHDIGKNLHGDIYCNYNILRYEEMKEYSPNDLSHYALKSPNFEVAPSFL